MTPTPPPRPIWETFEVEIADDLPVEDAEVFTRVLNRPEGQVLVHGIAESLVRLQKATKRKWPCPLAVPVTDPSRMPFLLTPPEVAGLLRLTVDSVYARVERGLLTEGLIWEGKKIYFHRDRLLRGLERAADGHRSKGGCR